MKECIIEFLSLDKNNLSEFEKELVSNDIFFEKHFNLRIFLNSNIENKIIKSVETLKNKYTKIKICKELMNILNISKLEDLTKDITKNFNNIIKKWMVRWKY